MATIRRILAGVLFVLGICPLLLLNIVPFNNAIACLSFWAVAFILLLPDESKGRSIPLRLLLVAMILVGATLRYRWERQKDYDALRERIRERIASEQQTAPDAATVSGESP